MNIDSAGALVSGGASGLGEAAVRRLHAGGAHVVIADLNREKGEALAGELGDRSSFHEVNVTDADAVEVAATAASKAPRGLRIAVGCAGIGWAQRVTGKSGPHPLDLFKNVVEVNLVGMFNLMRLATTQMNANDPDEGGERGLFVSTASVAAFEGQIGQIAYSASKGGIVGMTLPAARDLSSRGIRVMAIAPGLFDTPLLAALPEPARQALGESIPFPSRLGLPAEFADLVAAIAGNPMLNGETIRLDGAIRMPPR
jgi:3-hydroxyacyl-CoA dehydrogenase/3-hydroxy-2-methylbutyryl-CoA dehydrogenase